MRSCSPWRVNAVIGDRIVGDETAKQFDRLYVNAPNCTVATVYRREDASLIAAAPDLLAVAKGCLGWLHSPPESQRPDPAWLLPLQSAIDRAERKA